MLLAKGVSCGPLAKGAALSSIAIHRHFILQGSRGHLSPAFESVGSTFFQKRLVPKRQGGFPAAEVGVFWKKVDFTEFRERMDGSLGLPVRSSMDSTGAPWIRPGVYRHSPYCRSDRN